MNNIADISNYDQCTSCGMCSAICPVEAIQIKLDENGFYRPEINEEKCIACGKCKKICYRFDQNISLTAKKNVHAYSAVNKDKELVRECSSGAISEEIMKACIKHGYKVVGVEYDYEKDNIKTTTTSDVNSITKYRGSKYFQSYTVEAFKEITKNKEDKYAVIGTPCQIYALRKWAEEHKKDNLLLIDFFCHGIAPVSLWKSYIKEFQSPFLKVDFRTKDYGWHNFATRFIDADKKEILSKRTNDQFYDLFFSELCFNNSCYKCKARSTVEYSDLRIGDFWGKRYASNMEGVSAVIVNTKKGYEIFKEISPYLKTKKVEFEEIISAQSYGKPREYDARKREQILDYLKRNKIKEAYKVYYNGLSVKAKTLKSAKNMIKKCPIIIQSRVRGIMKSV